MFRRLLIILIASILTQRAYVTDLFVTPEEGTCGNTCIGNLTQPYDSFLIALQKAASYDSATIILLHSDSADHYLFPPTGQDPSISPKTNLKFNNLTIKPLFCDERIVQEDQSLEDVCLDRDEKLTVYLKTQMFTLTIKESLTIDNIIFDGIEAIADINGIAVDACTTTRTRCCDIKPTLDTPEGDKCKPVDVLPSSILESLIRLDSVEPSASTIGTINFNNLEVINFWNRKIRSFVQTNAYYASGSELTFQNCTVDDVFFYEGLVSYLAYTPDETSDPTLYQVNFNNLTFTNYNYWNRPNLSSTYEDESRWELTEGYLLYAKNTFRGALVIDGGNFSDLNAASRYQCFDWSHGFPNNNQYLIDPGSKTDLWTMHYKMNSNETSSLVHIKNMNGQIQITNSLFTRILGVFGSVLRVDNSYPACSYSIQHNTFDDNYAFEGYANIIIAKNYDSPIVESPLINITDNDFLNATGCPGSYGNVGLITYWQDTPPTEMSIDFAINLTYIDYDNNDSPQIRIMNNRFLTNQIGVSNSLAIVGTYYTYLENNTFRDNGGLTAQLVLIRLKNSFLEAKKPNQLYKDDIFQYILNFFGQATAFYVDRFSRITSRQNTFQGNWGPFEGSLALGTSVTLKDWVAVIKNSIYFEDDVFIDHAGTPRNLARKLPYADLYYNSYIPPIITFSLDDIDSYQIVSFATSLSPDGRQDGIILSGVKFKDNIASFDVETACGEYAFQTDQKTTICEYMKKKTSSYNGFIKPLSISESIDDVRYYTFYQGFSLPIELGLDNVEITNNTLKTPGCLFPTSWLAGYHLNNVIIKNNTIHSLGETFTESAMSRSPSLTNSMSSIDGLFCGFQKEQWPFLRQISITAMNLFVENNTGIIFNLYPSETDTLTLINSVFQNNICKQGSIIQGGSKTSVISINNLFIQNTNSLGIFFISSLEATHMTCFTTYLQNQGTHASLFYLNDQVTSEQQLTKAYWNIVDPTYALLADDLTPQGGLAFSSLSTLYLGLSEFEENYAAAGALISVGSTVSFSLVNFFNNVISGTSVIGNFVQGSWLKLDNTRLVNNSITRNVQYPLQPALLTIVMSKLFINTLELTNSLDSNEGAFVFMKISKGALQDITINNFHALEGNPILILDSSKVNIGELECVSVTNLIKLSGCTVNLTSFNVSDLKAINNKQILISAVDTTLTITDLEYLGGASYTDSALITGGTSNVKIINSKFVDARVGDIGIFSLKETGSFFITKSLFEFTTTDVLTTIFEFTSSVDTINIQDCIFTLPGQVLSAENILTSVFFVENHIITTSQTNALQLTNSAQSYILNNNFIRQNDNQDPSFPESQIILNEGYGLTELIDNTFIGLYGSRGIIEIKNTVKPYNVELTRNIFIGNSGNLGGALYLDASLLRPSSSLPYAKIENSMFIQNNAIKTSNTWGRGGAIYQTSATLREQDTQINGCYFIKNTAGTSGGAIYFDYMPPKFDSACRFEENYANRPNHISSYAVKLDYFKGEYPINLPYLPNQTFTYSASSDATIEWKDIASGLISREIHSFALLDMFDQIVYDDNTTTIKLSPQGLTETESYLFSSQLSQGAMLGIYHFENVRFSYTVGQTIDILFISTGINTNRQYPASLPIQPENTIEVTASFRRCERGEYLARSNNITICIECQLGFWQTSPNPDAGSCQACDSGSSYCFGGDNVGPRNGYWRMNSTANMMMRCPVSYACIGNEVIGQQDNVILNSTSTCAFGYEGALCSGCNNGWAKTSNGECTKCSDNVLFYVRSAITIIVQLVLIGLAVRGTIQRSAQSQEERQKGCEVGSLMRILTNYMQAVLLIISLPITWPSILTNSFSTTAGATTMNQNAFSLDCIFGSNDVGGIRIVFLKLIWAIVGVVPNILVGLTFWLVFYAIKPKAFKNREDLYNYMITTTIVICFTMQPTIIVESFKFFQCINIYRDDTPEYHFELDYNVKCWEGEHLLWSLALALPSLVIWTTGFPLFIFRILRNHKHELEKDIISKRFSFLYGGYSHEKYFWEFIIMGRKVLFIGATVAASFHSVTLEIFIAIIALIISYLIHKFGRPYTSPQLNRLEAISLLSAIVTSFCGLYFESIPGLEGLGIVVILICVIANLVFLFHFLRLFFMQKIEGLKKNEKVYNLILKITSKFRCFKNKQSDYTKHPGTPLSAIADVNPRKPPLEVISQEPSQEDPKEHNQALRLEEISFFKNFDEGAEEKEDQNLNQQLEQHFKENPFDDNSPDPLEASSSSDSELDSERVNTLKNQNKSNPF